MTTAILDPATYDEISAEAAQVRTGRVLLQAVAGFFYLLGWLAGQVVPCLMWCFFAMRRGYRAAHGPSRRMQIITLQGQVRELQMQLSRFSG